MRVEIVKNDKITKYLRNISKFHILSIISIRGLLFINIYHSHNLNFFYILGYLKMTENNL